MNKLIKYIIIVFIIIIILILILLFFIKKETNSENVVGEDENVDSKSFEVEVEKELKNVESTQLAFNIKNCIQCYIDYINDNNYDAVMEVLDKNYIKDNDISKDNIKEKSSKFLNGIFVANEIYQKDLLMENKLYIVKGKILDSNTYGFKENFEFTVIIDDNNQTFSVIPEAIDDDNYKYSLNIEYDDENYYNEYIYKSYTEDEILTEYFEYYRNLAVNNQEEAFMLLDDEYKNKRFNNSEEKYIDYLNEIDVENAFPDKYVYNVYENYKEYVCVDKTGKYYIFKETAPMEFKIELDTYTIESDKFIKEYDNSDDNKKVMMCIDKWMNMIENKDYENAYNLLNETFRKNNFGDLDKFKNYIKENMSNNYSLEFKNQDYVGEKIYTQKIILSSDNENIQKEMIVKLEENRKFILSFNIE